MDPTYTSSLLKCNLVCICLHVARLSIWVAHQFMQNWTATSQSFATDPSNRKRPLIDCKTASRTSCYSWGLSADPTPPVTLCSSSSVTCQSIRTKCLCDGRRQSVSKQGENGRDKTGLEEDEKMRKDEGKRLLLGSIVGHCPV